MTDSTGFPTMERLSTILRRKELELAMQMDREGNEFETTFEKKLRLQDQLLKRKVSTNTRKNIEPSSFHNEIKSNDDLDAGNRDEDKFVDGFRNDDNHSIHENNDKTSNNNSNASLLRSASIKMLAKKTLKRTMSTKRDVQGKQNAEIYGNNKIDKEGEEYATIIERDPKPSKPSLKMSLFEAEPLVPEIDDIYKVSDSQNKVPSSLASVSVPVAIIPERTDASKKKVIQIAKRQASLRCTQKFINHEKAITPTMDSENEYIGDNNKKKDIHDFRNPLAHTSTNMTFSSFTELAKRKATYKSIVPTMPLPTISDKSEEYVGDVGTPRFSHDEYDSFTSACVYSSCASENWSEDGSQFDVASTTSEPFYNEHEMANKVKTFEEEQHQQQQQEKQHNYSPLAIVIPARSTSKTPEHSANTPVSNPLSSRRYIHEASVAQVVKDGLTKSRYLFLFSDILVITRQLRPEMNPDSQDITFQVKNIIPLQEINLYSKYGGLYRQQNKPAFDTSILETITIDNLERYLYYSGIIPYLHTLRITLSPDQVVRIMCQSEHRKLIAEYVKYLPIKNRSFDECMIHFHRLFNATMMDYPLFLDTIILTWIQYNGTGSDKTNYSSLKSRAIFLLADLNSDRLVKQPTHHNKTEGRMLGRIKSILKKSKQAISTSLNETQTTFTPTNTSVMSSVSETSFDISIKRKSPTSFECDMTCSELNKQIRIQPTGNQIHCTPSTTIDFINKKTQTFTIDLLGAGNHVLHFVTNQDKEINPILLTSSNIESENVFTFTVALEGYSQVSLCKKYIFSFLEMESLDQWTRAFHPVHQHELTSNLNDFNELKEEIMTKNQLVEKILSLI